MNDLQAQINARRALQTDRNLARQPDADPVEPSRVPSEQEANVVEMPDRSPTPVAEVAPVTRSRRKSSSSKRKNQASASKQGSVPFRQLRDNKQPFVDELRLLEEKAERINQLLAERAQAQSYEGTSVADRQYRHPAQAQVSRVSASNQQTSSRGSQQISPLYDQEFSEMAALDDEDTESLKLQAERITQLLAELEDAIQQAGTLSAKPKRNGSSGTVAVDHPKSRQKTNRSGHRQSAKVTPQLQEPFETGSEGFSGVDESDRHHYTREVYQEQNYREPIPPQQNIKRAVQEAAETAQALRHLSHQEYRQTVGRERIPQPSLRRRTPPPKRGLIGRLGLRLRSLFSIPQKPMDRLGDALLWVVISAVVRVGSRFLIATFPAYSALFICLMLAPAAVAVYLAVFVPNSGFVSVYRLFLIMLGLLIGGRF